MLTMKRWRKHNFASIDVEVGLLQTFAVTIKIKVSFFKKRYLFTYESLRF